MTPTKNFRRRGKKNIVILVDTRRWLIKNLCDIFRISDLNAEKIISAVENEEFSDFEDCLQEECAVEAMADYIVTRNPDDYMMSRIKVIEPEKFVKLLRES